MKTIITTRNDLRNWVDAITSNWDNRSDSDVEIITNNIQRMDHPRWGTDWTEFLLEVDLLNLLNE